MILAILLLLSGLTISGVAIYYSVMGLIAIFSAAAFPIMVMGISLEVGKLVIASWIKAQWERIPKIMKVYGIVAVTVLMIITSLGIFGFLSKAHSDQTLVSGDVQAKIAIYDEKIKTAKENIESDRTQLKQMDEAVDQLMGRSSDEKGADKANAIRKSQQKDRGALAKDIEANQKRIASLNDEAAPVRAENRKVEAEVGPIKYIAAFVYGANPDANILERAVTWVIILIVIVFDPLAIVMLLASQMTFAWIKKEREEKYKPDDGPLAEEQISQLKEIAREPIVEEPIVEEPSDPTLDPCYKCGTPLFIAPGIGPFCPNKECDVLDNTSGQQVELPKYQPSYEFVEEHTGEDEIVLTINHPVTEPVVTDDDIIKDIAKIIEKPIEQPVTFRPVFKRHQDLLEPISIIPEVTADTLEKTVSTESQPFTRHGSDYVEFQGKRMHERVLRETNPELFTNENLAQRKGKDIEIGFGSEFPIAPKMGDVFTMINSIPHVVFKYNGKKWIEINRQVSGAHLTNEDYVRHLIEKLSTGEYDPSMLTSNEEDAVAQFIKNQAS